MYTINFPLVFRAQAVSKHEATSVETILSIFQISYCKPILKKL